MKLYCPQCGNSVESSAKECNRCGALFTDPNGWRPVVEPLKIVRRQSYALWFLLTPFLVFGLTFGSMCAIDCTVMPHLTFFVSPALTVIAWILLGVDYWENARPDNGKKKNRLLDFAKVVLVACILSALYFASKYV
jgi:hypothetical protein